MTQTMIRRAEAQDISTITAIVQAAFQHYVVRIGRRPAPMDQDYGRLSKQGQLWVAVEGADITGVLVCYPNRTAYFLETVAVDPGHQAKGLGRILTKHAEARAVALGHGKIALYTNAAMTENIALYEKLGYSITERRNEDGFERVYFCKVMHQ